MKIPKPKMTVDEVFKSCISNMKKESQERFCPCLPDILAATKDYEDNMEKGHPQNVAECRNIQGVPKSELKKLYTEKLSKIKQPAREYYDKIISLAPGGICPYCKHQIVTTLDHYFPKAHYISLVITPTNLIPACSNCNDYKQDLIVKEKEDAIFNPYYEDCDGIIWLKASLNRDIVSDFLTMTFSVCPPEECDPVLQKRLENQFNTLRLNNLYSKHAAEELIAVASRHLRIFKAFGASEVRKSILESLEDNTYRPNSWQSAMYRSLDDDWYLNKWLPKHL